jgi:hypothetical protein
VRQRAATDMAGAGRCSPRHPYVRLGADGPRWAARVSRGCSPTPVFYNVDVLAGARASASPVFRGS